MPSFPRPGSVTVCEINRDLITADNLSDDRAKDTYGKVLGMVFAPVPFQSDELASSSPDRQESEQRGREEGEEVDLQGVSWHQHKHIVAFISGSTQVIVRDYEDSEGKDACILTSDSQRDVKVLEWRPNGGRSLSVGCKQVSQLGGICIWAPSYPGNSASVRSGAASFLGALSRGPGTRWTLVDFLRRLGTPIRRGFGGITILKWSPTGDYFFAAKFDGTFYLWETNTWTSEPWSSTSGFVTVHVHGATWDPEGRMILLAFAGSLTLGSIHFASKPPSLDAHLLPVDLPDVVSLTGSQGIEKIAWDASGERLAVSYKGGDDIYKGLIAIYDARRTPLISLSLIGFIRGPGDNPKPLAFSFHDKFKQGPLLSVVYVTELKQTKCYVRLNL
ncbi:Aladin [Citrus sinensis]|nr:Aladin [Citrus sinensis]